MGFGSRRPVKLAPGLRLNISKSGFGLSLGPLGASGNRTRWSIRQCGSRWDRHVVSRLTRRPPAFTLRYSPWAKYSKNHTRPIDGTVRPFRFAACEEALQA